MTPTTCFTLETHDGPYESWGETSALLRNGETTQLRLHGQQLLHQIECPAGFLFVTDYDCPFEEATCFTLASPALRRLSYRRFGAPYASCMLQALVLLRDGSINVLLDGGGPHKITIRRWGIPYLYPRLSCKRITLDDYRDQLKDASETSATTTGTFKY